MSQSITGSHNTVQTLSPAAPFVTVSGTINAYGTVAHYAANTGQGVQTITLEAALFGPASGHFTIVNSGLIETHGSVAGNLADVGIVLGTAGSIFNSGTILGGGSGIAIFETIGGSYVENSKLIAAGAAGAGIVIFGNSLTSDKITNSGTISGATASKQGAIQLNGKGTVINSAGGLIIADQSYAIGGNKYSQLTVNNAGTIVGLYGGINLQGGGFATNAGYIHATGTRLSSQSSYAGINASLGGTVVNSGTIGGQGGINVHYGYGTITSAIQGYIRNSGLIEAFSTNALNNPNAGNFGAGLEMQMPGTIVNAGFITASNAGIYTNDGVVTVQNLAGGTIISAIGIDLSDSTSTGTFLANVGQIINAGTITGSEIGVELLAGGTVTNSGTIAGQTFAVDFAGTSGSNRLVAEQGAVFTGIVSGGNGVLELAQGSGTGTLTGLGSQFISFSTVAFDPSAAWKISGNAAGLASGELITGLGANDTIILTGFTETSDHYANQQLTLNGSTILDIAGNFSTASFLVTSSGGSTTISTNGTAPASTALTLTSANTSFAAGTAVIGNGLLGTFSLNKNGSFSPTPVYGAVFAPASLGTETIHNAGFIEANGAQSLGPYDAGIVIGGTGTLFNTGTILGNSGVAMFGTSGSDYISNTKLIAGSYGVGFYLAGNARISNSGTIIGTSGTHINANAIELRGTAFVTNSTTGTIDSVGADALELRSTGTVLNAGLITGYGAGVNLRDTGFLSNASTGIIDGYRIAVGLYGGGTIINAGRIINTGTGHTTNTYVGIELGSYGYNSSATSSAIITNTGTITGADFGIDAVGTTATITNSGLILSEVAKFTGSNSYGTFTGYGAGIELTNSGTVTNQAGGSIIGYNGIQLYNGYKGGLVDNLGLISGSLFSAGVFLQRGGDVINAGIIHAQHAAAIYGHKGTIGVANSGTITADYGIGFGNGGGYATNSGSIIVTDQGIGQSSSYGGTGTVINSGLIEAAATMFAGEGVFTGKTFTGAGIALNGGTITNQKTGTIIAGGDGIITYNEPTTINNAGTIIGTGQIGVYLRANGSVTNTGLIEGYRAGVRDKLASATVINAGTIIGTAATFVIQGATGSSHNLPAGTYFSTGIVLKDGGTIINQIGGTVEGQTAISLQGPGEYANNAGLVISTGHTGIYLDNLGSAVNSGTVQAIGPAIELYGGGNVTNTGLASSSNKAGIYLKQSGTVTNSGTAIGTSPGINLAGGGTIINTGTATGDTGLAISGASGYVRNQNIAIGSTKTGIYLQDGGSITNTGLAQGVNHGIEIFSGTGLATNTGTMIGGTGALFLGQATLTNAGTIIGTAGDAVSFATGLANRLIIDPGAVFSGTVAGGGGILELAPGTGTINGLGSSFVNFNTIELDPSAAWVITGNTAGLTSGELITGFGLDDTIILTGLTETTDAYANQQLTLNGNTILDIAGNFSTASFLVTSSGGSTTISADQLSNITISGTTAETIGTGVTVTNPTLASGILVIGAGSSVAGTIALTGTGNQLIIEPAANGTTTVPADIITGFTAGDTIQLAGVPYNAAQDSYTVATAGTVTIDANGTFYNVLIAGAYVGENNFTLNGDIALVGPAVCYLSGTRIATPAGEVPVETLRIGDTVITRFNGYRQIKWIGRQSYATRFIRNNFEQIPVRITAGALAAGIPHRDLLVSPGHSMLIEGQLILAKNLVNGVTILQTPPAGDVHYYQLEFETHDCVLAEGAWSESYADTPDWRAKFHNAAEFFELYPGHIAPAEQTLCAPRHLEGPALEAILRPLAAQAAGLTTPGRLHGFIETITGATIAGWAWDEANPQLPVLLEILADGRRLGSVLACQPRADLQAAGYAQGQSGFTFTSPLGLPASHAGITIRRARDGAQLPFLSQSRAVA